MRLLNLIPFSKSRPIPKEELPESQSTTEFKLPDGRGKWVRKPTPIPGELAEWFESDFRPQQLHGKALGTARTYECALRAFMRHLNRPARIQDLEENLFIAFALARRIKVSYSSVLRDLDCLYAMANFAHCTDRLSVRPARKAKEVSRITVDPLGGVL